MEDTSRTTVRFRKRVQIIGFEEAPKATLYQRFCLIAYLWLLWFYQLYQRGFHAVE